MGLEGGVLFPDRSSAALPGGVVKRGAGRDQGAFEAALPLGWERRVDPQTGREYYLDHASETTSWHLPSTNASGQHAASASVPSPKSSTFARLLRFGFRPPSP